MPSPRIVECQFNDGGTTGPTCTGANAPTGSAGVDRVRVRLGSRDAPRIRSVLNDIADLLRQSAATHEAGRLAAALDLALQADAKLERLQDYVK